MSDMKIKFSVHQNPLKDEQGRTTYQVRQDTLGAIDTKGLRVCWPCTVCRTTSPSDWLWSGYRNRWCRR